MYFLRLTSSAVAEADAMRSTSRMAIISRRLTTKDDLISVVVSYSPDSRHRN